MLKYIFVFSILFFVGGYANNKQDIIYKVEKNNLLLDKAFELNNKGIESYQNQDYENSLKYFQESLSIRKKILGENHIDIAMNYNNLGGFYKSFGKYDEALYFYQKSLYIIEKTLGKEHKTTATTYHNIGRLYHILGDYPKALNYLKKSLDIRTQIHIIKE